MKLKIKKLPTKLNTYIKLFSILLVCSVFVSVIVKNIYKILHLEKFVILDNAAIVKKVDILDNTGNDAKDQVKYESIIKVPKTYDNVNNGTLKSSTITDSSSHASASAPSPTSLFNPVQSRLNYLNIDTSQNMIKGTPDIITSTSDTSTNSNTNTNSIQYTPNTTRSAPSSSSPSSKSKYANMYTNAVNFFAPSQLEDL
jgi:hypothetical protein